VFSFVRLPEPFLNQQHRKKLGAMIIARRIRNPFTAWLRLMRASDLKMNKCHVFLHITARYNQTLWLTITVAVSAQLVVHTTMQRYPRR
jgi:hypothetical protein